MTEAAQPHHADSTAQGPSVLCVDDDQDVAEVVQAVLEDEGYRVSCLNEVASDAVMRAVGRLEPDVVLLDSASTSDYGEAWDLAASIHRRSRPVPVVMFTAHAKAAAEAKEGTSERSQQAAFASIVSKPFHLDELLEGVATAAGRSVSFDRTMEAESARTDAMVAALEARGASDVRPSKMREWALFRDQKNRLVQLYWWQARGVYQLGRYRETGQMVLVGQFTDRDGAIAIALPD